MDKIEKKWKAHFWGMEAAALVLSAAGAYGICAFRQCAREEILRCMVMAVLGIGLVGYLVRREYLADCLDYDNDRHVIRFWCCLLTGLAVSFAGTFLPAEGWPFVVIYVTLTLFGDFVLGTVSASVLLMLTVLLSGGQVNVFMLYFMSGILAAVMFRRLDASFKVGIPLAISMMVLLVCQTANLVLFANERLNGELFVIPVANMIVTGILLVGILKVFSSLVTYKYRVAYMELTDSECKLLSCFKEKARQEYYQCMHTAYFCDRIARRLGLDADAVKAAGYYHRISALLDGPGDYEQVERMMAEHHFPPMVKRILKEYLDENTAVVGKETAVLIFAGAVTASVMYLFSQEGGSGGTPDYERIVDAVFRKKLETGILQHCDITMGEITQMKKIFKEEKLYYDFLR